MANLTEKEVQEIFGIKTAGLPDEQRTFINAMVGAFTDAINKSNNGLISDEVLTKRLTDLSKQMSENNTQALAELRKENAELVKQLKSTAETVEKLKQKGISMHTINKFDEKLQAMFDSEKFQDFAAGNTRKSGQFDGFSLKEVVSMTDNYEGTHLITQQQSRVVSPIANKPLHMREILQVLSGDPAFPNLAFTQVDSMDRNARYVTENGRLPESSIKTKEVQTGTKRLGTHMRISKRMLKSRAYLRSYILAMMREAVYMAEDWNILFGDGNGENLLGIANHKGVMPIEKIITDNIVEGKAGSVQSVTAYNGGADALVEFTNPQPLVLDGMAITFTGATSNANLNATHNVVKVTDRQVLLLGVAISEEEASAAKMTFKVNNAAFKSIEAPNSEDVIKTAFAVMTFGQYFPNFLVLNPITVNAIDSEKDALGRNLGLVKVVNGIKYIASRPVVEYAGIPAGKYMLGDLNAGAHLVDYTSLTLEWAEDVETKLTNEVVLIVQEEVIFPVYMPWTFAYGDMNQLKLAITKPVSSTTTITTEG